MKKHNFILRSELGIAGMLGASVILIPGLPSCAPPEEEKPPNIILILADDMGFSDLGSYGSEIQTPNLDQLSENGVSFTQFYNQARSCPSRASLLTGLYSHQTGIGNMTSDEGHDSYRGDLNYKCVTMAEALGNSSYSTYMTGKWHVTKHEGYWSGNEDHKSKHNWPLQRGFDKFFGTIIGAGSFFDPITLVEGNEPADLGQEPFYYTDAINDYAVQYIEEHIQSGTDKPFFLYVSHVAPHWPLHALPEDIERYKGIYDEGWDQIRKERFAKMKRIGLVDEDDELAPRDPRVPPWEEEEHQEWRIRAMEVYAAQIDIMDQGIGRIITSLVQNDLMDNTMIVFLSDNGGCAEILSVEWGDYLFFPDETRDGQPVQIGNDPDYMPGPEETYQSYGIGWANVSNTPFKLYKHYIHEGGIATPLIVHWPKGIKGRGEWREYPSHIIDMMPTFLDIAGAEYPKQFNGEDILPLEGRSLMPYIQEDKLEREDAMFWEHNGNRAVREGKWKLVQRRDRDEWELYNMQADRKEMNDLAAENPGKVRELKDKYDAWADRIGVLPLPRHEHIE